MIDIKKKTNDEFIKELNEKHPTLILLDSYKNSRTKVTIKCNVCEREFQATPSSLYMGHGCPYCNGRYIKTHDEFVHDLSNINTSIIPIGKYKHSKTKMEFKCLNCNHVWSATPNSILSGKSCPCCAGNLRKTNSQFVKELEHIFPSIQAMEPYINNRAKISFKCRICGNVFRATPHSILSSNSGCTQCSIKSLGERRIFEILKKRNIHFKMQYCFQNCKDEKVLPFDFYIPSLSIAIEFDGKQHYTPIQFFGGVQGFNMTKKHDELKNKYCYDNNINLIRIPYTKYNEIEQILNDKIAI